MPQVAPCVQESERRRTVAGDRTTSARRKEVDVLLFQGSPQWSPQAGASTSGRQAPLCPYTLAEFALSRRQNYGCKTGRSLVGY